MLPRLHVNAEALTGWPEPRMPDRVSAHFTVAQNQSVTACSFTCWSIGCQYIAVTSASNEQEAFFCSCTDKAMLTGSFNAFGIDDGHLDSDQSGASCK